MSDKKISVPQGHNRGTPRGGGSRGKGTGGQWVTLEGSGLLGSLIHPSFWHSGVTGLESELTEKVGGALGSRWVCYV